MGKVRESYQVIKITGHWGYSSTPPEPRYARKASEDDRSRFVRLYSNSDVYGVDDLRDATNIDKMKGIQGIKWFYDIKNSLRNGESIELVRVNITIDTQDAYFDESARIEFLRKEALSKLSEDEIKALGVAPLAVYEKLKNHNVVDSD